jgi:alpha-glucosidase
VSDWTHLRASIPMLIGMGLSGLPFVGSDIGGFAEAPSAELFTRWMQAGVFYPFMRSHTTFGTPDQEPWAFGTYHEALNRRAIELRYELLPYVYTVMKEATDTGMPALRPLFLEFPDEASTYDRDDEFMFGSQLLAAPVMREAQREREVYLPAGEWYDFWTGKLHKGPSTIRLQVTLDSIPIFVRAGAFVFRQPAVQHTGEMRGQPLHVSVYPAARASSEAVLYEDDGETLEYSRGDFARRRFTQARIISSDRLTATIEIGAPEGRYRPDARDLIVEVRWEGQPERVMVGTGTVLARRTTRELDSEPDGWTLSDEGFVIVKQPDRFEAMKITIEGPIK